MRLQFDRSTRALAHGSVLVGGSPARLLRLSPAGTRLVSQWRAGAPVDQRPAAVALARRLIAAGVAHPLYDGPPPWTSDDVALVIPARDRARPLAECLAAVGPAGEVLVVDDGSTDPAAIEAVVAAAGANLVSQPGARGPAAARNLGARATLAPVLAFVDSDVRAQPDWLEPLLAELHDPRVAAVAPRVVAASGAGAVAAYEAVRSPLDLGPLPGLVGLGRRTAFVPAAALVVRRSAFDATGGFDESLRIGEDVDFVWRLVRAGWAVRYRPTARVTHPYRPRARSWLAQRVAYGASAAALAQRHPGQMRHVVLSRGTIAAWGAALAGQPLAALAIGGAGTALLARRLAPVPGDRRRPLALAAAGQLRAGRQLLDAGWRAYPPLVVAVAASRPRTRRPLALGLTASVAVDYAVRRPALDPVRFGALRIADDLAYATGVWLGCARHRTLGPLLPQIVKPA